MTFFVRVWVDAGGSVAFVNADSHPITQDMIEMPGATVYDGEVSGDYMPSDEVMAALHLDVSSFSVSGRTVSGVTVSVRPDSLPTAAEKLDAERAQMVVSRFQAKAALAAAGLLTQAETAVAAADQTAQLAWAEAIEFKRMSPTILALAPVLGLTDDDLDDLFRAAAQIEA